jgi:hypothetical protein
VNGASVLGGATTISGAGLAIRGESTFSTGVGLELFYNSGVTAGQILAYNRDTTSYIPFVFDAGGYTFYDSGTPALSITSGRVLINGATDDAASALQVAGVIYSNTGLAVGGLPDYGQLLWLNGAGSGTEAVARLNNIDGDAWFDATSGHYQGFRFGFNQSYWQWTAGIDSTDYDTFGFYPGAAQPYGSFALKLLQSGRVLINSATDDTTSALIVSGVINTDTGYSVGASTGYTGDLNDSTSTKIADVVGGIITAVYY